MKAYSLKKRQPIHIDRSKACPFLLKVYPKYKGEHSLKQFEINDKELLADEIHLYTWSDASLRELTDLLKEFVPEAKQKDSILEYYVVYPNPHGKGYLKKPAGTVFAIGKGKDDLLTIHEIGMRIGDRMDINIKSKNDQ